MKTNPVVIFTLILTCLAADLARCEELPRKEVKLLVQSEPGPYPPEDFEAWRQRVKSHKGITPDLLLMIRQEKDWELVGRIFSTLKETPDVTAEMLEDLKKPLGDVLSKNPHSDMLFSNYVYGVIRLMAKFPSVENERYLLSLMGKHDGYYNSGVFESLGSIGTAESLPAMKELLASYNYPRGGGGDVVRSLEDAIKSIEKRTAAAERRNDGMDRRSPAGSLSGDGDRTGSKDPDHASNDKSPAGGRLKSYRLVWGGLFLAGTALFWVLIKNRRA